MRRMCSHPGEYRKILLANYLCIGFVPGGTSAFHYERESETNLQIFICNCFHADVIMA